MSSGPPPLLPPPPPLHPSAVGGAAAVVVVAVDGVDSFEEPVVAVAPFAAHSATPPADPSN